MQQRNNRRYFVLASVVLLGLTTLMVGVDAQAQIAFVSNRAGNWEIYVMDIDGQNPRNLTKNRHNDWHPSWSPDGQSIVFASNRDGNLEIYMMDANGNNQRNLTKIATMIGTLHGLQMAHALPLCPIELGTGKST